jgi:mono/diheme cytochrome c family protein
MLPRHDLGGRRKRGIDMARVSGLIATFVLGLLALPVGVVLLAWNGWLPSDALSRPPLWEAAIGQHALGASLAGRAKGLRNPVGANDSAALFAGMKVFRDNCAGCHGGAGTDSRWGTGNFYPRVPQFWRTDERLPAEEAYVAVHDGIRYSGMGGWNGTLKERQIWEVANFVSRMHHLPPDIEHAWFAGH